MIKHKPCPSLMKILFREWNIPSSIFGKHGIQDPKLDGKLTRAIWTTVFYELTDCTSKLRDYFDGL